MLMKKKTGQSLSTLAAGIAPPVEGNLTDGSTNVLTPMPAITTA